MNAKFLFFFMVLTRISAFFLILPVFSWRSIPVRVKTAAALMISLFFAMVIPSNITAENTSVLEVTILLNNEAFYGLALGLIILLIFNVIKVTGRIIERQMGMAMAQVLDPMTGENGQPLGMLLEIIFIVIFLSCNGHHMFLMILARSYEAFPAGQIPNIGVLTEGVVKAGSNMLTAGLRLAAPILTAFLLLMITMGVLARLTPEMNILFISLPLRVGLGLMMTMVFIPFINSFTSEFADWMAKLLPI